MNARVGIGVAISGFCFTVMYAVLVWVVDGNFDSDLRLRKYHAAKPRSSRATNPPTAPPTMAPMFKLLPELFVLGAVGLGFDAPSVLVGSAVAVDSGRSMSHQKNTVTKCVVTNLLGPLPQLALRWNHSKSKWWAVNVKPVFCLQKAGWYTYCNIQICPCRHGRASRNACIQRVPDISCQKKKNDISTQIFTPQSLRSCSYQSIQSICTIPNYEFNSNQIQDGPLTNADTPDDLGTANTQPS